MMWKKIAMVLLAVIMLSMTACGGSGAASQVKPQHFSTVGLCVRNQADAEEYYDALVAGLKGPGCGVLLEDCQNDQSRQNEKVRYMISQGCELLVVEPVMVSALDEVIAQAKQAGVPLVLLDREPEAAVLDTYEKMYYVGCEIAGAGAMQAQLLDSLNVRGDLNGDGTVSYMMLRGPEDHLDAQLITDGCNQALEQTDAVLLHTISAQWTMDDARAQCARGLSQYGRDIEVIFCNDIQLTLGAVEAVKNGGWTPGQDVYIIGLGSNAQLEEWLDQGVVAATVHADTQQRVELLVQTIQKLLSGKTVEKYNYVEYSPLTPED